MQNSPFTVTKLNTYTKRKNPNPCVWGGKNNKGCKHILFCLSYFWILFLGFTLVLILGDAFWTLGEVFSTLGLVALASVVVKNKDNLKTER